MAELVRPDFREGAHRTRCLSHRGLAATTWAHRMEPLDAVDHRQPDLRRRTEEINSLPISLDLTDVIPSGALRGGRSRGTCISRYSVLGTRIRFFHRVQKNQIVPTTSTARITASKRWNHIFSRGSLSHCSPRSNPT